MTRISSTLLLVGSRSGSCSLYIREAKRIDLNLHSWLASSPVDLHFASEDATSKSAELFDQRRAVFRPLILVDDWNDPSSPNIVRRMVDWSFRVSRHYLKNGQDSIVSAVGVVKAEHHLEHSCDHVRNLWIVVDQPDPSCVDTVWESAPDAGVEESLSELLRDPSIVPRNLISDENMSASRTTVVVDFALLPPELSQVPVAERLR